MPALVAGMTETATPHPLHATVSAVMAALVDRCTVNGEQVVPQPGGFYSGWITSWIVGPFKGIQGSNNW